MSDQIGKLLKKAKDGDSLAFARLLTAIEDCGAQCLSHKDLARPPRVALRIGITGPPGAGKSTLVGQLLAKLADRNLKVGVLAVDPSSPFTRGAILGDRIRYSEFSNHQNVFIRSIGTRGSLGGLSGSAHLMLRAFDACGFDLVLVETVGVGQTELDIMYVADDIWVVLVPESGDSIQAMKAGLLEIADFFIVNKSDRPGSAAMAKELGYVSEGSAKRQPVLQVVATEGTGLSVMLERIDAKLKAPGLAAERSQPVRLQNELLALLRSATEARVQEAIQSVKSVRDVLRLVTQFKVGFEGRGMRSSTLRTPGKRRSPQKRKKNT